MDDTVIQPVILAGGSGTRLWPLSREAHPKQFLALPHADGPTLLQQTLARVASAYPGSTTPRGRPALRLTSSGARSAGGPASYRAGFGCRRPAPWPMPPEPAAEPDPGPAPHPAPRFAPARIIVGAEHRFLAAEQLRSAGYTDLPPLVLEPEGRNTAPAIALAAACEEAAGRDPLLLILPADHHIARTRDFHAAVARATPLAEEGYLVTFGVTPERPETGYGYIRRGESLGDAGARVARFTEKPDAATARQYLEEGGYLWNAGIFLFRASRVLAELERHAPDIPRAARAAIADARHDLDFLRPDPDAFRQAPARSIDYAVMEATEAAAVTPLDAGWTDIGSWEVLAALQEPDAHGNHTRGDTVLEDCTRSLVEGHDTLVAALGLQETAVIATPDAVFAAPRDRLPQLRALVERLREQSRPEVHQYPTVHRPWGHYRSMEAGERYQVKHLHVRPGARLSLQRHRHRAEHWIVVAGTARVTRGKTVYDVREDQSTYIPLHEIHCLENPGEGPLEVIEVQTGDYLGEDDIERMDRSHR
ncbi:mannose-1-phosphate guanylyltransferase/mannose-6-phosphate isomerase [Thioalkalivibrio sp. ALE23]|uniref:mannose-1-phosphate guanylyltransferase/mannose-6-phosphate isomerase n=1 Tax=Thioalkalivibrio sp. ALE23 TaxID=1265495 RepID=UPI00039E4CE3|nr:mannose-1-phosphate guanylyltransferase/mannose-6-phosphate isomerase [Thioalkalivibrio sp. ALE23]